MFIQDILQSNKMDYATGTKGGLSRLFLWRKVGLMGSGAAGVEDGIKDTYSLEVKGGC